MVACPCCIPDGERPRKGGATTEVGGNDSSESRKKNQRFYVHSQSQGRDGRMAEDGRSKRAFSKGRSIEGQEYPRPSPVGSKWTTPQYSTTTFDLRGPATGRLPIVTSDVPAALGRNSGRTRLPHVALGKAPPAWPPNMQCSGPASRPFPGCGTVGVGVPLLPTSLKHVSRRDGVCEASNLYCFPHSKDPSRNGVARHVHHLQPLRLTESQSRA